MHTYIHAYTYIHTYSEVPEPCVASHGTWGRTSGVDEYILYVYIYIYIYIHTLYV